jgi:hypothetical protein
MFTVNTNNNNEFHLPPTAESFCSSVQIDSEAQLGPQRNPCHHGLKAVSQDVGCSCCVTAAPRASIGNSPVNDGDCDTGCASRKSRSIMRESWSATKVARPASCIYSMCFWISTCELRNTFYRIEFQNLFRSCRDSLLFVGKICKKDDSCRCDK